MRLKRKKRKKSSEKGGFILAAEALDLLRSLPLSVLVVYFIGTLPFLTGFLFFLADMSRSAFAADRCIQASLGMALLFIWMKSWQAVFSQLVRAHISGGDSGPWGFRRIMRVIFYQMIIQPSALIVLPVTICALAPFSIAYSFYESVTATCGKREVDLPHMVSRAGRSAFENFKQGIGLVWIVSPWMLGLALSISFAMARVIISANPEMHQVPGMYLFLIGAVLAYLSGLPLSPFGCVVAANISFLIIMVPYLLGTVLGIETFFSVGSWHVLFNTTFVSVVYCGAFLVMDPVVKAAHVLKTFYAESRQSGEDLLIILGD